MKKGRNIPVPLQEQNQVEIEMTVDLLSESQKFMREQKSECSFVSLRDVQRVLTVLEWFLNNFHLLNQKVKISPMDMLASSLSLVSLMKIVCN